MSFYLSIQLKLSTITKETLLYSSIWLQMLSLSFKWLILWERYPMTLMLMLFQRELNLPWIYHKYISSQHIIRRYLTESILEKVSLDIYCFIVKEKPIFSLDILLMSAELDIREKIFLKTNKKSTIIKTKTILKMNT